MITTFKEFLIPSIDLLDGNIVRLYQGDYQQSTSYNIDLQELLTKYQKFQNLHIVDLNAAKGDGITNLKLIQEIRKYFKGSLQVGGGMRSIESVENMLFQNHIDKVVLGTIAITDFDLTKQILNKFKKEKIVLAIDCKIENGKFIPKINGWSENHNQNLDLFNILDRYKNIAKYILVTDISLDGTMLGPNLELYQNIKTKFPNFKLQASGGISSINDLMLLKKITNFAIVGKALYQGLINDIC